MWVACFAAAAGRVRGLLVSEAVLGFQRACGKYIPSRPQGAARDCGARQRSICRTTPGSRSALAHYDVGRHGSYPGTERGLDQGGDPEDHVIVPAPFSFPPLFRL